MLNKRGLTLNSLKAFIVILLFVTLSACAVRPKLMTPEERADRIQHDWQAMFSNQEPLKGSLTIYQAMARAVKYNLDIRVKEMETAYTMADVKYASATMLPSIVTSAGYTARNNNYSILSPTNPDVISTTEDRDIRSANLQFSWNVLDFGVSYIQSKQKADMYLVSEERKRKIIQQIIKDTRYAYWRAWAAQKLGRQVNVFKSQIQHAIRQSQIASNEKLTAASAASYYRAELWQAYRDMTALQNQLSNAQPELMSMINARPTTRVRLAKPRVIDSPLPKGFPMNSNILEMMALQNRPDLREEDYRHRISMNEITKAKLKMLPGLLINSGEHYNSNSYLVNNTWADFGTQFSWDILRLYSNYQGVKVAKAEQQVGEVRRLALSMAVITQVEIAKLRYLQAIRELNIAKQLCNARYQYYVSIRNEEQSNLSDHLAVIDAKAKWLVSKLGYYTAYAEWQNAAGQLLDSVGYDPLNQVTSVDVPVNTLAHQIRISMRNLPIPVKPLNIKSAQAKEHENKKT